LRGYLLRVLPVPLRERLKAAWRCLRHAGQRSALLKEIWTGSALPMRQFLTGFQALIANSRAEASELRKLLPDGPRVQVVHSGVDAVYWSAERALWAREERAPLPDGESEPAQGALDHGPATMGKREGVLCIARFDPQKGQHRLIQALRGLDVPLTLAGPDNPNYPSYRALCGRLAGPRVSVLPRVSRAKLKALYHQCRVHALCSWYETTGLTGLEAGCCGARVVMTARGGTHDYGGDRVWYANPSALASMRQAVEQALVASQTPDLLRRVQRHFTWEQSARALVQAYEAVLSESRQLQAA
jgi:glycosyltransferase involved in cell wall biosynthesis